MKYREFGFNNIKIFGKLLKKLSKNIFYLLLLMGIIIGIISVMEGKDTLQYWEQTNLDKKVYEMCCSRPENRIKGAFIEIGATYPEEKAEEQTIRVIQGFNEEVQDYQAKRKSGEITKRWYSHEKEAVAYWAKNSKGDYGILINWRGDEIPEGYKIKYMITN